MQNILSIVGVLAHAKHILIIALGILGFQSPILIVFLGLSLIVDKFDLRRDRP